MDNAADRLARCFNLVFPDVPKRLIRQASPETVRTWDSLNLVTLVAVIEEEFGIVIDASDPDRFDSFETILRLVEEKLILQS